jgi:hypothetical protein
MMTFGYRGARPLDTGPSPVRAAVRLMRCCVTAVRRLSTTDHLEIRRWAESREAVPIADRAQGLGFDFPDYDDDVDPITWDRWFDEFDARDLEFVYQLSETERQTNHFELKPREPDRALTTQDSRTPRSL